MSVVVGRGWEGEFLDRHSKAILIITHNGEIRGQIEVLTPAEKERWELVMEFLNEVTPSPKRE